MESDLPLEIELAISKLTQTIYPNTRFGLTTKVDEYSITIEFEGFFTESHYPNNRPYQNPNHEFYRNPKKDFWIQYFTKSKSLSICGWWRSSILSLHYNDDNNKSFLWMNENGKQIATPYPDGDNFEAIANELLPILCHTPINKI